jgi:hypothetical protein
MAEAHNSGGERLRVRYDAGGAYRLRVGAKMKSTHASLNDASDGNFAHVEEYEVPS